MPESGLSIEEYFSAIDVLFSSPIILAVDIKKEKMSSTIGIVYGCVTFINESNLSFMEYFEVEKTIQVKTYSYHYQDLSGQMVFRYDNAPHYPQLKTFPNHKHLKSDTIESDQPDIAQVMNEI